MAKIDEIKEILNSLRIAMSIIAGIIVVLIGKLFTKFENNQFDFIFWLIIVVTILVIIAEATIVFNISKKTKEIKDL
jgi:F0F1-type ATP synthase assembly protein I